MNKLTAIRIKNDDNTYSDQIPVSALAENIEWDSTHSLIDILGEVDVDINGNLQDQINEKLNGAQLNEYVANELNNDVTSWLNQNVNPVGSAVIVDNSLSISGAAADAKKIGEIIEAHYNVFNLGQNWNITHNHLTIEKTNNNTFKFSGTRSGSYVYEILSDNQSRIATDVNSFDESYFTIKLKPGIKYKIVYELMSDLPDINANTKFFLYKYYNNTIIDENCTVALKDFENSKKIEKTFISNSDKYAIILYETNFTYQGIYRIYFMKAEEKSDTTLSIEGGFADAKTTGDLINQIKNVLVTEIDYTNNYIPNKSIDLLFSAGTTIDTTMLDSQSFACQIVEAIKGDKFIISGGGGNHERLYAILDENLKLYQKTESQYTAENEEIEFAFDGYLISNVRMTQDYNLKCINKLIKIQNTFEEALALEDETWEE